MPVFGEKLHFSLAEKKVVRKGRCSRTNGADSGMNCSRLRECKCVLQCHLFILTDYEVASLKLDVAKQACHHEMCHVLHQALVMNRYFYISASSPLPLCHAL